MNHARILSFLAAFVAFSLPTHAQGVRFDGITLSPSGRPVSANVSVCTSPGLTTTAGQVIGNTAILTMSSNPITAGFAANMQIAVSGFTGGDTYFNVGTLQPFVSTATITAVSATTITYPLTHANAAASTNGSVFQMGNVATPCAPLASIFSDSALAVPITQPGFVSSGIGNFGFFASSGSYAIQFYGSGVTTYLQPLTIQAALNANNAFTGIDTACQLNGELYVGTGITCWAGSDIGAQINTAIAALPAIGGTIHPIPGITYNFSTPIVGATVGKYIRIVCAMDGATVLNYTPTTGAAITLAGGSGNLGGVQFENCTLTGAGSGNATTGLQIGTASVGVAWGLIKGNTINGFGTGISINSSPGNSYGLQFINNQIQSNGTGAALAGEGVSFIGGLIGNNATGVTCAAAAQVSFLQTSFDDNSTVAVNVSNSNCRLTFNPGHFENAGGGTEFYLTQSAGFTSFFGADGFQSDTAGGTAAQFATVSGGHIEYQAAVCATATRTLTQMFNLSGSVNAILRPRIHVSTVCSATGLATIFNAAYTGGLVIADAEVAGSNANTGLSAIKGSIPQLPDLIGTEGSGVTWRIRENAGNLDFFNGSSVAVRGSLLAGGGLVPGAAAVGDLGSTSLPWANLWIGTAATNNLKFQPSAMAAARVLTIPDPLGAATMPYVIASGTTTLTANAALAAVTSQAANTTAATGALTTDAIEWSFATAPGAGDNLCHVLAYVTAGNVNFVRTNPTAAAQNVTALVINWRVIR